MEAKPDLPAHVPIVASLAATSPDLAQIPPAPRQITVAVYDFPDLTGQRKPTAPGLTTSDISTAVTQGASSIVIEALKSAGGGTYFDVVDRTRDADQVRERSVIADSVGSSDKKSDKKKEHSDDKFVRLRPAEYLLNGGVIAFERSVLSTNTSLSILGIGGSKTIVRNYVSVTMRLVRSDTAEVVTSVTAYRSIDTDNQGLFSRPRADSNGGIYPDSLLQRYPSASDYVQADLSGSRAEMTQIAIREAIEADLLELIDRTTQMGLWERPSRFLVAAPEVKDNRKRRAVQPAATAPKETQVSTVEKSAERLSRLDGSLNALPDQTFAARVLWDKTSVRLSAVSDH